MGMTLCTIIGIGYDKGSGSGTSTQGVCEEVGLGLVVGMTEVS